MAGGRANKITAKRRHEGIQLVLEEKMPVADAAKKMGIGKSTLAKFVSDFKKNGNKIDMEDDSESVVSSNTATTKQSELLELKNRIKILKEEKQILRNEKDVLKKTIAILMNE